MLALTEVAPSGSAWRPAALEVGLDDLLSGYREGTGAKGQGLPEGHSPGNDADLWGFWKNGVGVLVVSSFQLN